MQGIIGWQISGFDAIYTLGKNKYKILNFIIACKNPIPHGSVVKNLPAVQETQEMWV